MCCHEQQQNNVLGMTLQLEGTKISCKGRRNNICINDSNCWQPSSGSENSKFAIFETKKWMFNTKFRYRKSHIQNRWGISRSQVSDLSKTCLSQGEKEKSNCGSMMNLYIEFNEAWKRVDRRNWRCYRNSCVFFFLLGVFCLAGPQPSSIPSSPPPQSNTSNPAPISTNIPVPWLPSVSVSKPISSSDKQRESYLPIFVLSILLIKTTPPLLPPVFKLKRGKPKVRMHPISASLTAHFVIG